jgi:tetratricopeptide (TPR) repeat protein
MCDGFVYLRQLHQQIKKLLVVISLIAGGCANLPPLLPNPSLPLKAEIHNIPIYSDDNNHCGPASLASAISFAGVDVSLVELSRQLYIPEKQGSLQVELRAQTRQQGLIPYVITPDVEALLTEVAAGKPVLVMQNLGFKILPQWHYSLVIGFDFNEGAILLRSGSNLRYTVPMALFRRTWQRADNWAMVVVKSDQLPSTAEFYPYMRTIFELEQVGQYATAYRAYQTANQHWPNQGNGVALMGMANTAYRLGDIELAISHLQARATQYPQTADTWNNLSVLLAEHGCRQIAIKAAFCAVALKPQQPLFQSTLNKLTQPISNSDRHNQCDIPACPMD